MPHILHTKDIGSITAYGDALTGGYAGTREQFYNALIGSDDLILDIDPASKMERGLYITTQGIPAYIPPAWENGTDAEIVHALKKHYSGDIDITEYWNIGDEREIALSAIEATSGEVAQPEQTITMVLLNKGGKNLSDGGTCAFVVGMKNCLAATSKIGNYRWASSPLKTWLNNSFRNAIPESIVEIFKLHEVRYANGSSTAALTSSMDYFTLPAGVEVCGTSSSAYYNTNEGSLLQYYVAEDNRKKDSAYLTRSIQTGGTYYNYVNVNGVINGSTWASAAATAYHISVQGAI